MGSRCQEDRLRRSSVSSQSFMAAPLRCALPVSYTLAPWIIYLPISASIQNFLVSDICLHGFLLLFHFWSLLIFPVRVFQGRLGIGGSNSQSPLPGFHCGPLCLGVAGLMATFLSLLECSLERVGTACPDITTLT